MSTKIRRQIKKILSYSIDDMEMCWYDLESILEDHSNVMTEKEIKQFNLAKRQIRKATNLKFNP